MSEKKAPPKAVGNGKPKKQKGKLGVKFMYVGITTLIGIVSIPAFVVILVGSLPTFAAWMGDKHPHKPVGMTVAAMNIAGMLPVLLEVLPFGQNITQGFMVLSDVTTWLTIYGCAAVGWGIVFLTPKAVHQLMDRSLEKRITKIKKQQETLSEEWGPKVRSKE